MNERRSGTYSDSRPPGAGSAQVLERYLHVTGTPSFCTDGEWKITWINEPGRQAFAKVGLEPGVQLTDDDLALEPRLTAKELESACSSQFVQRDTGMRDGRMWRMIMMPVASLVDGRDEDGEGLFITCYAPVHDAGSRDEIQRLLRTLAYRCDEIDVILDLIPTGIVMTTGEDPGVTRVNAHGAEALGVPDRRVLRNPADGTPGVRIYRGDSGIDWNQLPHCVALQTGEAVPTEHLTVRRQNGSTVQVLASAVPLFDDAGTVRGSVGALIDVSELQDARQESSRLARHSAQIARLAVYALTQTDVERLYRHCVRSIRRMLDGDAAVFFHSDDTARTSSLTYHVGSGKTRGMRGLSLPTGRGSLARKVLSENRALLLGDLSGGDDDSCPEELRRDGMRSLIAQRVSGEDGCFGMLAVFSRSTGAFRESDGPVIKSAAVTMAAALQRIRVERRLRDAERRLAIAATEQRMHRAERLASLGTLAAGIAHEINNPLNSMLVNAELGNTELQRGTDPDKVASRFEAIVRDVKRCGDITHNVLQFASPERHESREHVRITDVIDRTAELVGAYLRRCGTQLDTKVSPDLPAVAVNVTGIEQVLVNLLQNAAQVGANTVKIRAAVADGMLELSVADDGPGIPEQDLRRIFDPFFSTKGSSEGTGLGLSLVERIVHEHDGDVEASNGEGGGACFTLWLPLEQSQ